MPNLQGGRLREPAAAEGRRLMERRTYPKSTCCIPGCPRWSRKYPGEWVCGRHWKMFGRRCRRALNVTWTRMKQITSGVESRVPRGCTRTESAAWWKLEQQNRRLWEHGKRRTLLREAGL